MNVSRVLHRCIKGVFKLYFEGVRVCFNVVSKYDSVVF